MINVEHLVGSTLSGRYEVLDKIGSGGMAIVYKAHDNVLNRDVAIKVLRESYESESTVVSNFIKEAQSSAKLVHTNVVSVYDVCEFDGINFIVMELVNGITLKEYIKNNQRIPWQEACDYAIQIGQGISAAHEHGIIHRDIKPQNIIMSSGGVLKVTDFGIAKAMENDKAMAGGTALGSVHYISPEQAKGGFTDFRSDIYSLGIVLYEMLAGRVPFDGDTPMSVALMHIEEEAVSVKCVNIDVPADLDYVTMKAMNREPGKRYQTMKEFLEDLRAVLADETLPSKENDLNVENDLDDTKEAIKDLDVPEVPGRGRNTRVKAKVKKQIKKKKAERNAFILAISTVAALILVGVGLVLFFIHPVSDTVPDLVNMTLSEADSVAQKNGYSIDSEIDYAPSDTVENDHIIAQSPEAGTDKDGNTVIHVWVSLGRSGGNIEVPNVENMKLGDAIKAIEDASLKCQVEGEYSDIDEGFVIRYFPAAGTKLHEDETVKLYYSLGPGINSVETKKDTNKSTVPSVVGMTLVNAKSAINNSGLVVGQISNAVSSSPAGTVIKQSPNANIEANSGDKVDLVLSSGPNAVQYGTNADENQGQNQNNSPQNVNVSAETQPPKTAHTYIVNIPSEAKNDIVNVQIIANGVDIHNSTHLKSEEKFAVEVPYSGDVQIQVFIDGAKTADKTVTF